MCSTTMPTKAITWWSTQTYHKIYRVNNDEAVQRVNRIYIPLNSALDIPAVKARTISKEGKITELRQRQY